MRGDTAEPGEVSGGVSLLAESGCEAAARGLDLTRTFSGAVVTFGFASSGAFESTFVTKSCGSFESDVALGCILG